MQGELIITECPTTHNYLGSLQRKLVMSGWSQVSRGLIQN